MSNTIPSTLFNDRYWASLIHLFKNHYRLNDYFTTKFFNMSDETIRIQALKRHASPWSNSEKIMFNLTLHLFKERNKI